MQPSEAMIFYPFLKVPNCQSWVVLSNFPPNNWEEDRVKSLYVFLNWANGGSWHRKKIDILKPYEQKKYFEVDFLNLDNQNTTFFLSLIGESKNYNSYFQTSRHPTWRASIGLSNKTCEVSYQGEIEPFPCPGSLLSIPSLLQEGSKFKNYLIFVNIELSAVDRYETILISDISNHTRIISNFEVKNNHVTSVCIDKLGLELNSLPLITCKGMSGIPIFLSLESKGAMSLEHTHPPASYAILGHRWKFQKLIKSNWLS